MQLLIWVLTIFILLIYLKFFCRLNSSLQRVPIKNVIPEPKTIPGKPSWRIFFLEELILFYTFLKHQEDITDLIFIHGFDITLDEHSRLKKAAEVIRKIGSQWDKRVIEVENNLFPFLIFMFRDYILSGFAW
jgi:hypothetical protein